MVRAYATEEERGVRFAAIVGIVGFINVPIVFLATTLWRTQHPVPTIFQKGLVPAMLLTLLVCLLAFTLLYTYLLLRAVSPRQLEAEIRRSKQNIEGKSI